MSIVIDNPVEFDLCRLQDPEPTEPALFMMPYTFALRRSPQVEIVIRAT